MSQNVSHAVMAQRHEAHDSLDFFPTPPWATRALCEFLKREGYEIDKRLAWDPACGEGHMARPLAEYFKVVARSDIHGYGHGDVLDFLFPGHGRKADWIITNPPFRLGREFISTARAIAREGVAMLVRTAFLESADRYREIFEHNRPAYVVQFVERVPMVKGRVDKAASTATSYCWLIWDQRAPKQAHTIMDWMPPCRARLERPNDYEAVAA